MAGFIMAFAKLEAPDCQYLSIAQGWFGLGDYAHAKRILDQIIPELQQHPEVLKLRWQICVKTHRWEACMEIAENLKRVAPDDPQTLFCQSYARIIQSHIND